MKNISHWYNFFVTQSYTEKKSDRRGVDNFHYPKDTIVVDDRGYFDCKLFRIRIEDKNWFITRLKDNILYETVEELDLPDDKDQHILKDETIYLTGKAAEANDLNTTKLRRVVIYIPEEKNTEDRIIVLITNNLEWQAATIAELYKIRWSIETFFKLIKQNLQIKTFIGTSENACKSQIFIALICYLLLELIRRTLSKTNHCFGHFVTLISSSFYCFHRFPCRFQDGINREVGIQTSFHPPLGGEATARKKAGCFHA